MMVLGLRARQRQRHPLPFLLGILALACFVEGFVPWFRPTVNRIPALAPNRNPHDRNGLPTSYHRSPKIPSLYTVKEQSQTDTSSTITSVSTTNSEKIQEMGAFVCIRLLQSVMVELMAQAESDDGSQGDSMKALSQTVQRSETDKPPSPHASVAEPPAHAIDSAPLGEEDVTASTKPTTIEETTEPTKVPIPQSEIPTYDPYLPDPLVEDSVTSAYVDAGWEDDDTLVDGGWHEGWGHDMDDDFDDEEELFVDVAEEEETEEIIYPEGSVPLPRAETPSYTVSPLEVVASNVVPLRPSSVPKKEDAPNPKAITALEVTETDTIPLDDASNAVAMDQVVTSADSDDLCESVKAERRKAQEEVFQRKLLQTRLELDAKQVANASQRAEEMVRRKLLDRRMASEAARLQAESDFASKAEELMRRNLLQRRLKMVASTRKSVSLIDEPSVISEAERSIPPETSLGTPDHKANELNQADFAAQTIADEMVRRRLLKKRIAYETAAERKADDAHVMRPPKKSAVAPLEPKVAEDDIFVSAGESAKEKTAEELFRRKLLKAQLEFAAQEIAVHASETNLSSSSPSLELEKTLPLPEKKDEKESRDELFQRRLLGQKLAFDTIASQIKQKKADELFRRSLLDKRLQYGAVKKENDVVADVNDEKKSVEELFQRRLLAKKLGFDAVAAQINQKKADELLQRKILENRLKFNAAQIVEERKPEIGEKRKSDELFQRRLLQKKLDLDAKAFKIETKKAGELFQRKLLQKKLEYDAAEIQKEIIQNRRPSKKFEYVDLAIEIIQKEREDALRKKSADETLSVAPILINDTKNTTAEKKESMESILRNSGLLVEENIEYDAAKIQEELVERRNRSLKKFEFAELAVQIIQKEREDALRKERAPNPGSVASKFVEAIEDDKAVEITDECGETSDLERRKTEEVLEDAESASPPPVSPFSAQSELQEVAQAPVPVSDSVDVTDFSDETSPQAPDEPSELETGEIDEMPDAAEMTPSISVKSEFLENTNNVVKDPVHASDSVSMTDVSEETTSRHVRNENSPLATPRSDWVSSLPTITQERYAKEAKLSHSFVQREFNPTWWATNNHFQTIVGTLFRKETMYSSGTDNDMDIILDIAGVGNMSDEMRRPLEEFQWDERCRVDTKDGDFFVVDWKYANKQEKNKSSDDPVCLICHGLESCSDSEIVREIAIACNEIRMDAACLNFRGCHDSGASCNLTPRGYHLGFTDDLFQQIEEVHAQNPNRPIYLSGFSLGAGVVTKLLTELGPKAYEYNICGAAVNAVPFDVNQNHMALNGPGFTKSVYGNRLLQSMKTRISKQYDQSGGFSFDRSEIFQCQTIMDFENLAICPVFGFEDAFDYYDKVKTIDKLHNICVPQFVIQAKDDPFFVGLETVASDESIPLHLQYTDQGGHCGYILHQRQPDERASKTSWMPRQLARFFAHIQENRGSDWTDEQ